MKNILMIEEKNKFSLTGLIAFTTLCVNRCLANGDLLQDVDELKKTAV